MSAVDPDPARGRLFLVTGADESERVTVARAVARALERSAVVDGAEIDRMLVSGRVPVGGPLTGEQLGQLLLRWSATIATAETFQLEGYDTVVTDDVQGARVEDFLDLAAPETVHLVVLRHPRLEVDTPHWGLWVEAGDRDPQQVGAEVLSRLDDARVVTAEQD
jgi:hypothetical protein